MSAALSDAQITVPSKFPKGSEVPRSVINMLRIKHWCTSELYIECRLHVYIYIGYMRIRLRCN